MGICPAGCDLNSSPSCLLIHPCFNGGSVDILHPPISPPGGSVRAIPVGRRDLMRECLSAPLSISFQRRAARPGASRCSLRLGFSFQCVPISRGARSAALLGGRLRPSTPSPRHNSSGHEGDDRQPTHIFSKTLFHFLVFCRQKFVVGVEPAREQVLAGM